LSRGTGLTCTPAAQELINPSALSSIEAGELRYTHTYIHILYILIYTHNTTFSNNKPNALPALMSKGLPLQAGSWLCGLWKGKMFLRSKPGECCSPDK